MKTLQDENCELQELHGKSVKGFIVQTRAEYVEGCEKILSTLQI